MVANHFSPHFHATGGLMTGGTADLLKGTSKVHKKPKNQQI